MCFNKLIDIALTAGQDRDARGESMRKRERSVNHRLSKAHLQLGIKNRKEERKEDEHSSHTQKKVESIIIIS